MTQLLLVAAPLLLIASLAGYGAAFAGRKGSPADFFESSFAGLFLVCGAALIANFFIGLGTYPGPFVLAGGLVLFALFQRRCGFALDPAILFVTFAVSVAFWLRSSTRLPVDAGLYYLSAMNWAAHQPLPLGLANLQAQFGFDSAWLLFESALRAGTILGWSHLAIAEIALRSLALGWIAQNFAAERARGENEKAAFYLITFAVLFFYMLVRAPSPATTDLPANILAFCAWLVFCRVMLLDKQDGTIFGGLPLLCLLTVLAISFKLSMLPLALLPVLLPAARNREGGLLLFRQYRVLGILLLYGILWLARNFLLSGCLAFPVAATCLAPAWNAGDDAPALVLVIRGWAREPGTSFMAHPGLFDMGWVPAWLPGFGKSVEFWLVVAAAAVALALCSFRGSAERKLPGQPALVRASLVFAGAGFSLWFFSAPNPRFSWVFFAILAVILLLPAIPKIGAGLHAIGPLRPAARRTFFLAVVLAVIAVSIQITRGVGRIEAPVPSLRTVAAPEGALIYEPVSGDQCWEVFPCTPYGFGGKSLESRHGRLLFRRQNLP